MNNEKAQALKGPIVEEIVAKANASKAIVVVTYHGLSVSKLDEIRRALHKENCRLHVYKNTLFNRAAEQALLLNPDAKLDVLDPFKIIVDGKMVDDE